MKMLETIHILPVRTESAAPAPLRGKKLDQRAVLQVVRKVDRVMGWVKAWFPFFRTARHWALPVAVQAFLACSIVIAFFLSV